MATERIKPSGWALDEPLTSAQITQLDINASKGVDSTGDDTLAGDYSVLSGAILEFDSGSSLIVHGGATETVDGYLNVADGGKLEIENGGTLSVAGSLAIEMGGSFVASGFSTVTLSGTTTASNLTISGSNKLKVASRSVTRTNEHPFYFKQDWAVDSLGGYFVATTATATNPAFCDLHVPHNVTVTNVTVHLKGASGHGALPANMPTISVLEIASNGYTVIAGAQADTSSTVANYENTHTVSVSDFMAAPADRTIHKYRLSVSNEAGTGSAAGLTIYLVTLTYTVTEYDEIG